MRAMNGLDPVRRIAEADAQRPGRLHGGAVRVDRANVIDGVA